MTRRRPAVSRERRSITFDGAQVDFTLQRSTRRKRTVQMQFDAEVGLKVMIPHTMTDADIRDFMVKRQGWILKHGAATLPAAPTRNWSEGGAGQLLGNPIEIVVQERDLDDPCRDLAPTVVKALDGESATVIVPPEMDGSRKSAVVRQYVRGWYRQEAMDHLQSRVAEFGNVMGVQPSRLKLSDAKKRWGSCSGRGSINLNWRLIMLAPDVIDYVVVHELAHLIELNHSAAFWNVVASVFPDHKERRRRLRENSPAALW